MYISYPKDTARDFKNWVANSFKKWSAVHPKGSNDNDRPGGAFPMAARAHNPNAVDARAAEVAHRRSFRL